MDDDLNISGALAAMFQTIRKINLMTREGRIRTMGAKKLQQVFKQINSVLNVLESDPQASDPEVIRLEAEREAARARGDFAHADQIRDRLKSMGIEVRDLKKRG